MTILIEFVEMINFQSYVQERVPFTAGLNAIVGPNGVGKSTIPRAVSFALFNHATYKLSELLREGAKSGTVIIGLLSPLDGHHYEIERRFTAKTTTRYGVYDAEHGRQCLAQGVSDVEAWIRQHLRIDAKTPLGTVFETLAVPQMEFTDAFLRARADRIREFDRTLDADSYKTASDNLLPAVRMLSEQAGTHRTEIARLEGMLSGLADLEAEDQLLNGEIALLVEQIAADQQSLGFTEERLGLLTQAQALEKEAEQAVTQAQTRFDAHEYLVKSARASFLGACYARDRIRDNLAGHTAYEEADSRLQDLDASRRVRDDLLQAQAQARSELAGLTAAKARLPDAQRRVKLTGERTAEIEAEVVQASHLQERYDAMQSQVSRKRDVIQNFQLGHATIQANITDAETKGRFLRDPDVATCPTCGSELTVERRRELLKQNLDQLQFWQPKSVDMLTHIQHESQLIADLQKSQGETQDKLRRLASERDLVRARQNSKDRQEELATLQLQIAGARDAEKVAQGFDVALAPYADLDNQLSHCQDQRREHQGPHNTYISNLTLAGEINKLEDAHNAVQRKRAELEQTFTEATAAYERARVGYNAQMHANTERAVRALRTALVTGKAQITLKRERLTVVKKSLLYLEMAQTDLDKVSTELQDIEETHAVIQWGRELLREAGPLVTRRLVRQISQEASSVYDDLGGNPGRRLEWSDDYALSLTGGGYTRSFRQLSGGERMAAALALRWALSRATSGVGIAVYDEPTANLDLQHRQAIAAMLGKLKRFSNQIWVMSHDDAFDPEADNSVHLKWDEAGSHLAA